MCVCVYIYIKIQQEVERSEKIPQNLKMKWNIQKLTEGGMSVKDMRSHFPVSDDLKGNLDKLLWVMLQQW